MKANLIFLCAFILTLILIAVGYLILHPSEFGFCVNLQYATDCFSDSFYFGVGKPLYSSMNAFALLFFILMFVPKEHLHYWYRIVVPIGLLGLALIIFSSPVRQNMLDPERVDVARAIGEWLLLLTLLVVGYSLFKATFTSKKARGHMSARRKN